MLWVLASRGRAGDLAAGWASGLLAGFLIGTHGYRDEHGSADELRGSGV